MADKIIIIKEKKRGCGCGSLILLVIVAFVGYMFYSFQQDEEKFEAERAARDAKLTPAERAARDAAAAIARPDTSIVQLKFHQAMRANLKDPSSYQPGDIRQGSHPQGYAYIHEYRAKNSFGAVVKDMCGLLCATNTGKRVWTFYDSAALPDLVKEIKP